MREVEGPRRAPTVVLLHGWFASASINWFRAFEPLGRRFRVIAPDLRGHGMGAHSTGRFRLVDCADDVAALMDEMGIASAIMVGYSMGGPIAQLMWQRHRTKVDGLVLCATSHRLLPVGEVSWPMSTIMTAAAGTTRVGQFAAVVPLSLIRRLPAIGIRPPLPGVPLGRVPLSSMQRWTAGEMRAHNWRMVFEAGDEIGRYNAGKWIAQIDVPTAVVVTARDRTVLPKQQIAMATAIPHAVIYSIDDNHFAYSSPAFAEPLVAACVDVAGKAFLRFPGSARSRRPRRLRLRLPRWGGSTVTAKR